MKTCPICKADCREDAIFCDTCGQKFEDEAAKAVDVEEAEVKTEESSKAEQNAVNDEAEVKVEPVQPEVKAEPEAAPIPPAAPAPIGSGYNNSNSGNGGYNGHNGNNNGYMGNDNYYNGHIIPNRNIALAVVLTIVTCGIYGIYWMIMLNDEVNAVADEHSAMSGGLVFLLSLVTCGIYGFFWAYQMGERVDKIKDDPNASSKILYLVLALFGFQIVNYCLMQDALNNKFKNN